MCMCLDPHGCNAPQAKLISPPHIFVNTPYEGVIEFKGPVEEGELLSFLDRLQIVPDHAAIKVVEKRRKSCPWVLARLPNVVQSNLTSTSKMEPSLSL